MKAEPNDNLVSCEAPTTPVDNDDSTPFDDFVKWFRQGDASAHWRKPFLTDVLGKLEQMHEHCEKLERERTNNRRRI